MGSKSKHNRNDGVRMAYADWLRLPNREIRLASGEPTSKAEFARKYGVSTVALWKWEQDPEFRKLVHIRSMNTIMTAEETEKAIAVLKAKAYEGNIQALKLLLNSVGLLNPEKEPVEQEEDIDFGKWSETEIAEFLKDDDGDTDET